MPLPFIPLATLRVPSYNILFLATGARLLRHRWTDLPTPEAAIIRVEALAIRDGQPLLQDRDLVVE